MTRQQRKTKETYKQSISHLTPQRQAELLAEHWRGGKRKRRIGP